MKRIIVFALVALSCIAASAQFRWGPTLGATITNLKFKQDLITVDRSAGFSAGVVTEMMFPGIGFGINSGVYYEQKGATLHLGEKKVWASQGYGVDRSYLHYMEIPINLRFKWTRMGGLEDYVAPYVYGGPTFGILLGHSRIKALQYAGGDIGMCVGGGFEIFKRWQLSADYCWGIVYAEKTKLLDDFSAKNRTINIRVSYLF